jgi:hypothetical protein
MTRRFIVAALVMLCSLTIMTASAFGQAVYGSILGTITDPSGAAVAGAKVTVTSVGKGTTAEATTNADGNYTVTHLIPDVYNVKAEAPGFKSFETANVAVSADTGVRVDGQFQVGGSQETVEVTAETPQLKTDRADVSMSFNEKYVTDLPILNRNFTSLELASPGTQKLVGWSHAATENPQGGQQIFVNGQHFSGTGFELDGTDNQDPILGIIVINPNLDAITETKMALQNYDAEFGKAIAGLVTVQTKSGSNDVHGSAFWFRRTDATQARDPFTQYKPDAVTGRLIPSSRWNQFGGSLGGPIIKNKLFFFGDYQGTRQTSGISQQLTIPTSTVLSTCLAASGFCDLSQYQPLIGNGTPGDPSNYLYDPNTGDPITGTGRLAFCGATEVLNPTPGTCPNPFQIPVGSLSPQALNILQLFPTPTNGNVQNNFVGAGSGPFTSNGFDTRIDFTPSQSLQVFGRFSLNYFSLSGKGALGQLGGVGFGLLGLAGSSITHNYSLSTGFTKTLSSSLLTDFRFGWFKYNPQTHKPDEGTTPATDFGIPNMNLGDNSTSGLPAFFLHDAAPNGGAGNVISNFGDGLNVARCNCPLTEREQQVQFVNNWTKVVGNHQFKVGADVRRATNFRLPSDANRTGQLNFSPKGTSNGGSGGLDLATFLLGEVTFMDRYVNNTGTLDASEKQWRTFYYGQDTWRITPKLTLNYGLRWEIYFPESVNGKGKGGFANIDEGIIRVGGFGPYNLAGNIDNNWKALSPRLGLAYQVTPKTVVRMGYGRSYDMGVFGSNFGHTVTQNLPVLVNQNVSASSQVPPGTPPNLIPSNDIVPAFTLANGPPLFTFPTVPDTGQLPLQGPAGNVSPKIRPTFQRLPMVDAWNLTVQHQLSNTMSIEAGYVASKGTHVFAGNGPSYNVNQIAVGAGTSVDGKFVPNVPQANRRLFFNRFIYPDCSITFQTCGNTGLPVSDQLTCCSSDLGNYLGNDASSNYNSLQVKFEKRFSKGLQVLAHYTFSHANNYDSDYYVDDPRVAYGPDDMNRNHVFGTNIVYELPFGKGHSFGSGAGRVMDLIIGGWQLNSISNWSSGLPWTPSYGECGQVTDTGPCRPDKASGSFKTGAGSFDPVTHTVTFFTPIAGALSISAPAGTDFCSVAPPSGTGFARPACGTIGNIGRNSFHGPRLFTSDLSVIKNFHVSERLTAQFRMDAFNLFNHPVYGFDANEGGGRCIDCGGNNGKITDIEADTTMRQLQFAVRFTF